MLALFLVSVGMAQTPGENYKLVYPEFIPANSSFDVSIITTNNYTGADRLELFIIPDYKISVNKLELKAPGIARKLNLSLTSLEGYTTQVYKANLSFSDSTILPGTYFQLLTNFKSDNAESALIKFIGVFKKGDDVLGYFNNDKYEDDAPSPVKINVNFYTPQKNAGKAMLFGKNSSFSVLTEGFATENLLSEFWLKLNDTSTTFLKIQNRLSGNTQFRLSTNSFQMLSVNSPNILTGEYINPFFVGKKSWYHLEIKFSFDNGMTYFYCNGSLFAKTRLPENLKPENMKFVFGGNGGDKTFQIDLLRFIDFNNSIEVSSSNKNYNNFISDSSRVLAQFRMDENSQLDSYSDNNRVEMKNVELVKSDAPIFAKAPELNISVYSTAYDLEWTGGDYKQTEKYVLEKSSGNSKYMPIYTIDADNSIPKTYSYFDPKDETSDVIYYRVKQIGRDGTAVYSSQVKVGQGLMEPFVVEQNFPNPFNPKTSITVDLLEDTELEITVYNLEGKEIIKLFKGYLSKGPHRFPFDGKDLPSGIYLYKVSTPTFNQTKKMILTK